MCVNLALTWGGVRFAWTSVNVLLPLCLGIATVILFFLVEAYWVKEPIVSSKSVRVQSDLGSMALIFMLQVPPFIVANRTTLSGRVFLN